MNRSGFSLIEALFALVLLGAVAIAALSATGSHSSTALRAERNAEAAILAEYEISRISALSPDELRSMPGELENPPFDPPLDRYHSVWRISGMPSDISVLNVSVAVLWNEGRFDLQTLLYRPAAGAQ